LWQLDELSRIPKEGDSLAEFFVFVAFLNSIFRKSHDLPDKALCFLRDARLLYIAMVPVDKLNKPSLGWWVD
jgi:hypothetical protein